MRALCFALLLVFVAPAALAKSVAVSVTGQKGSGEDKLDTKIRAQLASRGLDVVPEKALIKAAKKIDDEPDSEAAAKEAGADLWISVVVKKVKKKFVATGKLVELKSGRTLKSAKRTYKKASSASAIGDLLGTELAEAAAGVASSKSGEEELDEGPDDEEETTAKVVRPKEEGAPREERASTTTAVPKDEATSTSAKTTIERSVPAKGGEDKVLHLLLGGGSQVLSAYTVAVGPSVTGLAYELTPLVLLDAGAGVQIPGVGLGFELGLSFVPVKYQIDVDPAIEPAGPKGRFLDVGGLASYRLVLTTFGDGGSRLYLSPMLGFAYSSLSVEEQAPYAVVLSWSAAAPWAGARFGVVLDQLAVELDGRFKFIVSYSESPSQTGNDGSGTGFAIGANARYWMSDNFGVTFRLAYNFHRIGFSGEGSRTPFVDDPPLLDATAFQNDLRTSIGVLLAL